MIMLSFLKLVYHGKAGIRSHTKLPFFMLSFINCDEERKTINSPGEVKLRFVRPR
jgi:hypothetical protein